MSSNINPTNIDKAYPVAGKDNDSQGFRDNFTNIVTDLEYAKTEIEELQSNTVLKSAVGGEVLDNDMAGTLLKGAQVQDIRGTVIDATIDAGVVSLDVVSAPCYRLETGAPVTLAFTNFSQAGTVSTVRLDVTISVATTVTFPAEVNVGNGGLGNTISLAVGTYVYEFTSTTNGASIAVNRLSNADTQAVAVPAAAIGAAGDMKGMIAANATHVYVCIANYDGASSIWVRSTAAVW